MDDEFPSPLAFTNCRGNALESPGLCKALVETSSVSCIFVEKINKELHKFLENHPALRKILLVILHEREDENIKKKCRKLRKDLSMEKHQIIQRSAHDTNFFEVCEMVKKSIKHIVNSNSQKIALSNFVGRLKENFDIQVDDTRCHRAQIAAQKILRNIDDMNQKKAGIDKAEILPCQSDLKCKREMAYLDKELCRQRRRTEKTTLQNYAYDIKGRKLHLQLSQLQIPISESFKYFLQCLFALSPSDRKYFLQDLKLGLNERSSQLLQPLYEEYEKCRLEDEREERDKKLRLIDEQLTHGSLGLEHFFREMAVLYENILALKHKTGCKDMDDILNKLSGVMAEILMEGIAVEIMDGDTIHVPVAWLSAVLNKIENCSQVKVFKVSILGAQSCGKSTILNTVFGLNFPVSSGRCTKGAYMQLVMIEDELQKSLNCDYVLVIDSEGLMSRVKAGSTDFDNELSTFVIGLSDLTLVVIKGEGNEMQDVLPLAIHVFLRMNIVGEHQACHFVHQNMGAVGDMQKIATEIDAFVRDLNTKTLAAANDVDQGDRYTKFTDVLRYDKTKDNTYVPGLWDGTLPMAKTKAHYSQRMQQLKCDIIHHIEKLNKKFNTVSDVAKRIAELWDAIKYENFVFSFQNVLAVEAHTKLTALFDERQWKVKRGTREMIQHELNTIENEWRRIGNQRSLQSLIEESRVNHFNFILNAVRDLERDVLHYFQCIGCNDCSDDVRNRHLLVNYEKEFRKELDNLSDGLEREFTSTVDELEISLRADNRIHQLNTEMDDILKRKVHEAIRRRKSERSTGDPYEDIFAQLWAESTGDILRMARYMEEKADIKAIVQGVVTDLLRKNSQFYLRKIGEREANENMQSRSEESSFLVDRTHHLEFKRLRYFKFWTNSADMGRLLLFADNIIAATKMYYDQKAAPGGKRSNKKDAEMLFGEVLKLMKEFKDERFLLTNSFKVDLILHIETLAVAAFTEMDEKYCKQSSPEALLEKKKKSYYDLFMIKMGQGSAAVRFCDNVLKDMILKNIDDRLSCTELLHDLRVHCGEIFRDLKGLQASIMIDLYRENNGTRFIEYLSKYETFVKHKMRVESVRHFTRGNRMKELAQIELDRIIPTILESVDKTCSGSHEPFVKVFFSNIKTLKIAHTEAAAFMEIDVEDKAQFGAIVHQHLRGQIKADIIQLINSWSVEKKLDSKGLADFLFKEIVGCSARCPFCKVPCDVHSGGKTSGNHASTYHRPEGLGGMRWINSQFLLAEDCRFHVASDISFLHGKNLENSTPYKLYNTVYPSWTIRGDADPDAEKYWKWVFAQHNEKFAEHYTAKPAKIPIEWAAYSKDDISADVAEHYHVNVEL